MKKLLIVGAGGHGKVVAEAALSTNEWGEVLFLDAKFPRLNELLGYPVIGTIDEAKNFLNEFRYAVVAVGDAVARMRLINKLTVLGFRLPVIIHQRAWVSPSANLGEGSVVFSGAVINANASLEMGCIVNTAAIVEHDCCLGAGVHLSPNAALGGECVIGDCSWIGVGANIINGIRIGEGVTVGAGAAVVRSVASGRTVVGVPAKEKCK